MGVSIHTAIGIWLRERWPDKEITKEMIDHLVSILINEVEDFE